MGADLIGALHLLRLPDAEPPVVPVQVLPYVGQGPAEAEGLVEGLLDQRTPGGPFHHRRSHVQRSDDAVLRRGRDVHHEGFVEARHVQLPGPAILHVDHRGLAEGGEHLVRGVGGEHQGSLLAARGAHAIASVVELVERGIGVPSLVEVQHLDAVAEGLLDQLGVVAQAVVGGVGHHRQLHLRLAAARQRAGGDLRGDRLLAEFAQRDRPDDPQFVAFRSQVERYRPGHDDRVEDRLVAVAVHQHQVFATDHGVPDDLVRGGSAIDHEEGMVGAEIARGTVLGLGQGAGMVEQRAQLGDRDRQVGTQRVLPKNWWNACPTGLLR